MNCSIAMLGLTGMVALPKVVYLLMRASNDLIDGTDCVFRELMRVHGMSR